MTKTSFAEGHLRQFVERIERLEEEKKAIAADIAEVKAEAKGMGFNVKILNMVLAIRRKDANDRAEEDALLDVYLAALGMTPIEQEIETQSGIETKPDRISQTPANNGGLTEGQENIPLSKRPSVHQIPATTSPVSQATEGVATVAPGLAAPSSFNSDTRPLNPVAEVSAGNAHTLGVLPAPIPDMPAFLMRGAL